MDISFDRIPGLIDLLARMERFSLDSPGREYIAICCEWDKVTDAMYKMLDPMDREGDTGKLADSVIQRIFHTAAYKSYRAVASELSGCRFFEALYVERKRQYEHAREREMERQDLEQRCRGLPMFKEIFR
jgi:hypothetical protein